MPSEVKVVKWPKVVFAVGTPDYPDEGVGLYKDGLPRCLEEDPDQAIRRYLPESEEAPLPGVEALARELHRELCGCAATPDWCDASWLVAADKAVKLIRSQERQRVRRWAEEFEARMKGRMMRSQDAGEVVAISDIEWAMDELRDDVLALDTLEDSDG